MKLKVEGWTFDVERFKEDDYETVHNPTGAKAVPLVNLPECWISARVLRVLADALDKVNPAKLAG